MTAPKWGWWLALSWLVQFPNWKQALGGVEWSSPPTTSSVLHSHAPLVTLTQLAANNVRGSNVHDHLRGRSLLSPSGLSLTFPGVLHLSLRNWFQHLTLPELKKDLIKWHTSQWGSQNGRTWRSP
ncbi:hypothetical protein EDB86DRAFT_2826613 [Lactarius hatsudake]|nr:hypothetical protein EDB86DRAFT_2826613 [Lactarius hatsudake]